MFYGALTNIHHGWIELLENANYVDVNKVQELI